MTRSPARTITLFPWFQFLQSLMFWQAVWFLYFQQTLSAADAILLYVCYEIAVTLLEVPSGYMSDRIGRRVTLLCSAGASALGLVLLALGSSFGLLALGQALLGAGRAFASGTDSSLLFESLAAEGRENEVEAQELKAWRFGFAAAAISAVLGGALAEWQVSLPFWATAVAACGALMIMLVCCEPPRHLRKGQDGNVQLSSLKAALIHPVLVWIFAISVLMYVFSHIPFVFGQPFILDALDQIGLAGDAPLISGAVSATMMGVSLLASTGAPALKSAIGVRPIILLAFGLQIGLCAVLALTNSVLAIAFLFLRMVPDALSRPFIMAAIQPLLHDDSRATYLSLKSLTARVILSGSLWIAAGGASQVGLLAFSEMRIVLGWYVLAGVLSIGTLGALAWRQAR